jgi:hypothetical protein
MNPPTYTKSTTSPYYHTLIHLPFFTDYGSYVWLGDYINNLWFGGENHCELPQFCSFFFTIARLIARRGLLGTCPCVKFRSWGSQFGVVALEECPQTWVARLWFLCKIPWFCLTPRWRWTCEARRRGGIVQTCCLYCLIVWSSSTSHHGST